MQWLLVVALVAIAGLPAGAQVELGAPEGAVQTAHAEKRHDTYDLPVGPFGPGEKPVERLEGRVAWSAWRLDDPEANVAEVAAAYRQRLQETGLDIVLDCMSQECGGFDFRFGAGVLPPPGMLMDVENFRQLSALGPDERVAVSVLISRVLDALYVQTVTVEPAKPEAALEQRQEVETAPETVMLPQDERALLARLRRDGHVPVDGLEFDVGGTRLSPQSDEALDRLASMLSRDDELSVLIVGHSDNQGPLDVNIDLSRRRAEAVMQALIDRGVPPAQLEARGIGFLAPVATNATEEGRAANRRVELVLR